jgi:hypothetical protein
MAKGYSDVRGNPVEERVQYHRVPDNGLSTLTDCPSYNN